MRGIIFTILTTKFCNIFYSRSYAACSESLPISYKQFIKGSGGSETGEKFPM